MDFGVFTIQACASLIWKERRWYKRGGPIGGRGTNMLGELAGLQDSLRVAIQFGLVALALSGNKVHSDHSEYRQLGILVCESLLLHGSSIDKENIDYTILLT